MNGQTFLGDCVVFLILAPTIVYALLPLKDFYKLEKKKTFAVALLSATITALVFAFIGTKVSFHFKWLFVVSLAPVLIAYLHLVKGRIVRKLYCFFNAVMIGGNGIAYGSILAAPLEKDGSFVTLSPLTALVCLAVTIVLGIIYYKTLSEKMAYLLGSETLSLNYKFALGVVLFISILFVWVAPYKVGVVMAGRTRITVLTFLLLGPATFMLVYHTMWRVAVNLTENSNLKEANELMVMEQKRYEELRAYMQETRNLRHDFRQHLLVINEYARQGETDKLTDYISQFTASLDEHRREIAANAALDAMAAHYESIAESQGTHIKWLIELPAELPIKEADCITVFGNLVENALMATASLPEEKRTVHVNARMLSSAMLGITVKNPFEGKLKLGRDGLPRSGRAGHGIGLQSVSATVRRYGGVLDIEAEDGMFSAGALMYV